MDTVNFLGISIVGQSNRLGDGDCGIYVGSIMKGEHIQILTLETILNVKEANSQHLLLQIIIVPNLVKCLLEIQRWRGSS